MALVRLEYWSAARQDWWVGHKGLDLPDPKDYILGMHKRNIAPKPPPVRMIARAVDLDSGEVFSMPGTDLL